MPRLGQHFLRDESVLRRIAEYLAERSNEPIIEIGPGHGELTEKLLGLGITDLTVIERDPKLAEALKERFGNKISIVRGDALKELPAAVEGLRAYAIAGNIPYYISGHLFRLLGKLPKRPKRSVLLIQKEVAERLVAKPPHMNRLAASIQLWACPKILFQVGRNSFSPPPKVESAVVSMDSMETALLDPMLIDSAMRSIFSQPRKTLFNNLRTAGIAAQEAASAIQKLGLNKDVRPQDLSTGNIAGLTKILYRN